MTLKTALLWLVGSLFYFAYNLSEIHFYALKTPNLDGFHIRFTIHLELAILTAFTWQAACSIFISCKGIILC